MGSGPLGAGMTGRGAPEVPGCSGSALAPKGAQEGSQHLPTSLGFQVKEARSQLHLPQPPLGEKVPLGYIHPGRELPPRLWDLSGVRPSPSCRRSSPEGRPSSPAPLTKLDTWHHPADRAPALPSQTHSGPSSHFLFLLWPRPAPPAPQAGGPLLTCLWTNQLGCRSLSPRGGCEAPR